MKREDLIASYLKLKIDEEIIPILENQTEEEIKNSKNRGLKFWYYNLPNIDYNNFGESDADRIRYLLDIDLENIVRENYSDYDIYWRLGFHNKKEYDENYEFEKSIVKNQITFSAIKKRKILINKKNNLHL